MQRISHNSNRRKAWLAVALALGIAGPALAQSWDGTRTSVTPNAFTPPSKASADGEAKAAVAANRGEIQPAAFLPPPASRSAPASIPVRAPATAPIVASQAQPPVWNVSPPGTRVPEIPNNGERSIHEFGTGWKNFVNQKMFGAPPAPAVTLSRPHSAPATPTARVEWNWQGYDTYNQRGNDVVVGNAVTSQAGMHPDMAPYMKYAHLWRSSNNGFTHPVLSNTDSLTGGAIPLSDNRAAATGWRGGSRNETTLAINQPERGAVQPTNFAIASPPPAATNALPQRPPQFPPPITAAAPVIHGVPPVARESIIELCRGKARNLRVELVAPMRLRIAFLVRQQADAETLTEQLARLRDLAPYKINFEVQIGQ